MAPSALTFLLFFGSICSQSLYYLPMDAQSECRGPSDISSISTRIRWDVSNIYTAKGWEIPSSALSPKTKYRATVCGSLAAESASCNEESSWCLEVTNITNNECIQGISQWNNESEIAYYAITNSVEKYAEILGIRVQVNDSNSESSNCTNGQNTVNYDIQCRANETVAYSIAQDIEDCIYTISIFSEYGCFDWEPIPQSVVEYELSINRQSACKGETQLSQLNIDKIEWNLETLNNPNGYEKADYIFGEAADRMFRVSLCEGMKDNASKCTSNRQIALETAYLNGSCIQTLAEWDQSSTVLTYALCMLCFMASFAVCLSV